MGDDVHRQCRAVTADLVRQIEDDGKIFDALGISRTLRMRVVSVLHLGCDYGGQLNAVLIDGFERGPDGLYKVRMVSRASPELLREPQFHMYLRRSLGDNFGIQSLQYGANPARATVQFSEQRCGGNIWLDVKDRAPLPEFGSPQ